MLCAGLVHGDLSEYNVLVGSNGPVIIDLPQAVDAAGNNNARICWSGTSEISPLTSADSPPNSDHRLRQGDLEALRERQAHPP